MCPGLLDNPGPRGRGQSLSPSPRCDQRGPHRTRATRHSDGSPWITVDDENGTERAILGFADSAPEFRFADEDGTARARIVLDPLTGQPVLRTFDDAPVASSVSE